MNPLRPLLAAVALMLGSFSTMAADANLHSIPVKTIEGKPTTLGEYKGKVLLVVNVASRCGYTSQYKGLVITGFPSNDFGGQEPGTEEEIAEFCSTKYNVSFPMFSKVKVKGADQHPLYAALTNGPQANPHQVKWNFGKFLVGRDGKVLEQFDSGTKPESEELTAAIEKALAAK